MARHEGGALSWRVDGTLALGIAAFAILVVFHRLDVSAWFDEAYSYGVAIQPFGTFLTHTAWSSESNMVLYYLVLFGWLHLVSWVGAAPTEVLLRFPSAVFAVGASVVVFLIGRRLFGRVAGVVAAGLYTTNFLQMILAQNARGYSLELLLLGLSWLSLFIGLEENRTRWRAAHAVTSALAVYSGLFAGLVIISQVVALAGLMVVPGPWRDRVRASIRPLVVSLLAALVLVVPLAVSVVVHSGSNFVAPVRFGDVKAFMYFLAGYSSVYEYALAAGVVMALLLAGLALLQRSEKVTRSTPGDFGAAIALVSWFAVPMAVAFALTQERLNLHLFFPRYLVVVVPPLCLLAGLAVSALPSRLVQVAAALALIAVAWSPLTHYYEVAQVQDFQKPTAWIQSRYQPGDGVVCAPVGQCGIPMGYYFSAYPGRAHLDPDSPGRWDWKTYEWNQVTVDSIDQYAARHRRIFYVYAPLGPGNVAAGESGSFLATLASHGYRTTELMQVHANSADTTVILFEAH